MAMPHSINKLVTKMNVGTYLRSVSGIFSIGFGEGKCG
jgi:hypothetical protein